MPKRKRVSTETKSFGVSKREGHDSTKFYGRKMYDNAKPRELETEYHENKVPTKYLDTVL